VARTWTDRLVAAAGRARDQDPQATNLRAVLGKEAFDELTCEVEAMGVTQRVAARFQARFNACTWNGITILCVEGAEVQYFEASRPPVRDGGPERMPVLVYNLGWRE
jgi:hypothetical protein